MKGLLQSITPIDIFGPRIALTFKGYTEFKTGFGALVSIVIGTAVLGYALESMVKVAQGEVSNTTQ